MCTLIGWGGGGKCYVGDSLGSLSVHCCSLGGLSVKGV